jgi:tetratricopeptide (TPR) repeat protein
MAAAEATTTAAEADDWCSRTSDTIRRLDGTLPFAHVLRYLPLDDNYRLRATSRATRAALVLCACAFPRHAVMHADRLLAKGRVSEAESLLRPLIARAPTGPFARTHITLLNRYLLLLHTDMWASETAVGLRQRLFAVFKAKATDECHAFSAQHRRAQPAAATTAFLKRIAGLHLGRKAGHDGRAIGHEFVSADLPKEALHSVLRTGTAAAAAAAAAAALPVPTPETASRTRLVSAEATCILATFLCETDRYDAAAALQQQAAIYSPDSPLVHWLGGVLQHCHFQNFARAFAAYAQAIAVAPGFAHAYFCLGRLLSHALRTLMAGKLYRRCLGIDPHHHSAMLYRAMDMYDGDSWQMSQFYQIMDIHPTEMRAHRAVARILLPGGGTHLGDTRVDIDEAERVLLRAVRISKLGAEGGHLLDLGFLYTTHRRDLHRAKVWFARFLCAGTCSDMDLIASVRSMVSLLG